MIVAGPEGFGKRPTASSASRAPRQGTANDRCRPSRRRQSASQPRDDYAMMREVLTRRFTRIVKEDPGARQRRVARPDPDRRRPRPAFGRGPGGPGRPRAGGGRGGGRHRQGPRPQCRARAHLSARPDPQDAAARDPCLYFLQRLRDEAHRFAIGSHRSGRSKSRLRSALDEISVGIGAKRKRALLHHFGSAQAVARAGLADLEAVAGISRVVAQRIYDHFHGGP